MSNYKDSVRAAMAEYIDRQSKENAAAPKRKNDAPEKDLEKLVMPWLKQHGFDCQVYESKSVFVNGRWQQGGMKAGNADIQGTDPNGYSVAIELKAPGKRSSFWRPGNNRQQDYILNKIDKNGFACVVDSVELLERTYRTWLSARESGPALARIYLTDALPRRPKRVEVDSDLFD